MDADSKSYILDSLYCLFRRAPEAPDNWQLFLVLRSKILNEVDFEETFYLPQIIPGLYAGEKITIKGYHVDGVYNIALSSDEILKL